jgi:murein L,D-transpeptidase YcbB/YkuD
VVAAPAAAAATAVAAAMAMAMEVAVTALVAQARAARVMAPEPALVEPAAQAMAELAPVKAWDSAASASAVAVALAVARPLDSTYRSGWRRLLRRRAPIRCWPRSSVQLFHSRRPSVPT